MDTSFKLIHENKCILTESKSSTDDDTNKQEAVKSRRNKTNKNNNDSEAVSFMNKFQPLFTHKKEILNIIAVLVMIPLILA